MHLFSFMAISFCLPFLFLSSDIPAAVFTNLGTMQQMLGKKNEAMESYLAALKQAALNSPRSPQSFHWEFFVSLDTP